MPDSPSPKDAGGAAIPLARPNFSEQELAAVARVMESRHVTQGPEVAAFERELAVFAGGREVVAVSSGGSALLLSLVAAGVKAGDEVVIPDFVFPAAALCTMFMGAIPVPADVDLETMSITPETVARRLTRRTSAVVVVHPFGIPADVEGIAAVCPPGVAVIEDCACALGGLTAGGATAGTVGRFGCYSFHPRKSITTGEGGCIAAGGPDVERLRLLRDYGRSGRGFGDVFSEIGMNFRLSDIAAAIGRVQLERVEHSIQVRRILFKAYSDCLAGVGGVRIPAGFRLPGNTYQSLVVEVGVDPVPLVTRLAARGVMAGPSAHALSKQSVFFGRFPAAAASCDGSGARLASQTIVLPLFDDMKQEDVQRVSSVLAAAL